jgi:hypothetical protein
MVPPLAKEVTAQIGAAAGTATWAGVSGAATGAKAAIAAKTEVAALAINTVTATTGTLPTPNGATTIANAATPTVAELLEFGMENRAKIDAIIAALKA